MSCARWAAARHRARRHPTSYPVDHRPDGPTVFTIHSVARGIPQRGESSTHPASGRRLELRAMYRRATRPVECALRVRRSLRPLGGDGGRCSRRARPDRCARRARGPVARGGRPGNRTLQDAGDDPPVREGSSRRRRPVAAPHQAPPRPLRRGGGRLERALVRARSGGGDCPVPCRSRRTASRTDGRVGARHRPDARSVRQPAVSLGCRRIHPGGSGLGNSTARIAGRLRSAPSACAHRRRVARPASG